MLLSICIPIFNNYAQLNQTLRSMLKSDSEDFEVIIIDNCTPPENIHIEFTDKRLVIINRNIAVDGRINLWDSIKYGHGKYVMFCLDKDYIQGEEIVTFIQTLKENPELKGGYCAINKKKGKRKIRILHKKSLRHMYLGRHPSGEFFLRDIVNEVYRYINYEDPKSSYYLYPFVNDLLLATAISKGSIMIYNIPFIYTSIKISNVSKSKSLTYSPNNKNLYFTPDARIRQMQVNIEHLMLLKLNDNEFKQAVKWICYNTMDLCTYEYMKIMGREDLCEHYYVQARKITYKEMKNDLAKMLFAFYKTDISKLRKAQKNIIIGKTSIRFRLKYIKWLLLHKIA